MRQKSAGDPEVTVRCWRHRPVVSRSRTAPWARGAASSASPEEDGGTSLPPFSLATAYSASADAPVSDPPGGPHRMRIIRPVSGIFFSRSCRALACKARRQRRGASASGTRPSRPLFRGGSCSCHHTLTTAVFCEVSKYARVAHPDIEGESGRTRIKQKFTPRPVPIPQWYPPKWGLTIEVPAATASGESSAAPRRRRVQAKEEAARP